MLRRRVPLLLPPGSGAQQDGEGGGRDRGQAEQQGAVGDRARPPGQPFLPSELRVHSHQGRQGGGAVERQEEDTEQDEHRAAGQ